MNQQLVVNNFTATLKNPLAVGAVSAVLLPAGIGSSLPTLANGDFINMTVSDDVAPSKETRRMILKVTAVSGDTITFNASAEAWVAGSRIQSRLGAELVNALTAKNVPATDTADGYMTKEDHAKLTASANGTPRTLTASGVVVKADNNGLITYNSASAGVLTIPNDATGGFSGNEFVPAYQAGTGTVSFAAGSGVTLRAPSAMPSSVQYGIIAVQRVAANEWVVL